MIAEASLKTSPNPLFDDAYEILDTIGRGRHSVVYKAKKLPTPNVRSGPQSQMVSIKQPYHGLVALKVLLGSAKQPTVNQKRMKREALAMLACRHPSVVRLVDFVSHGELNYLAMEYASRGDLRGIMQDRTVNGRTEPFPQDLALRLMSQVLDGLDVVHRAGIIHRDIKPENLLLTEEGTIKIADFGIAHLPSENPALEDTQRGVGTFEYLAPESLEHGVSDPRTDLYSVAVTFFQLITGILPFEGTSIAEQVEQKLASNMRPLKRLLPDPTPFLEELLAKAMAQDPDQRFQSAAEFRDAIDALNLGKWRPAPRKRPGTKPKPTSVLLREELSREEPLADEPPPLAANDLPWLLAEEEPASEEVAAWPVVEECYGEVRPRHRLLKFFVGALAAGVLFAGAAGLALGKERVIELSGEFKTRLKAKADWYADAYGVHTFADLLTLIDGGGPDGGADLKSPKPDPSVAAEPVVAPEPVSAPIAPPMTEIGVERFGVIEALIASREQIPLVFSPVAAQNGKEQVVVALGMPGSKPTVIDGAALLSGEEIELQGGGFKLILTLDRSASSNEKGLRGSYRERISGASGSWFAR